MNMAVQIAGRVDEVDRDEIAMAMSAFVDESTVNRYADLLIADSGGFGLEQSLKGISSLLRTVARNLALKVHGDGLMTQDMAASYAAGVAAYFESEFNKAFATYDPVAEVFRKDS